MGGGARGELGGRELRVNWELIGINGRAIEWAYPRPPTSSLSAEPGTEIPPFQTSANQLMMDENANRAHLRTDWLAVK